MTDRAKKVSELNAHTNAPANNILLIVHQPGLANAETMKITLGDLFANVTSNVVITGDRLNLPSTAVPAAANSAGTKGEVRFDSSYIYVCVAANTWMRSTLSTW